MNVAPRTTTMHHALTPQQMLDAMRTSSLFNRLSSEEFRRVVGMVEMQRVSVGKAFVVEGSSDSDLYLLRRGRVDARQSGSDASRRTIVRVHLPGEVLNGDAFLTGCTAQWTCEAIDDVEVWIIPADAFHALTQEFQDIDARLGMNSSPDDNDDDEDDDDGEARSGVVSSTTEFDGQRQGECLLWRGRRDRKMFYLDAWLGWLLIVGAFAATIFAALPSAPTVLDTDLFTFLRVALFAVGIAIAAWHYLDWRNDDYIVTNQRVIHRERVLLLIDQQDECPLDKVQNVQVARPTWMHSLLDLGHITVEAHGARANVVFRWVRRPEDAASIVLTHAGHVRERQQATEKERMQQALRIALESGSVADEPQSEPAAARRPAPQPSRWTQLTRWFLPPMRESRGDDIVYHKHWLLLLQTTGLPLFVFLLSIALHVVVPQIGWQTPNFVPQHLPQLVGVGASLALLGWLIWRYEDWRNDVYIVTPDRVIDHDRSPFGLAGTQQKTAGMNGIQNVAYRTQGLLDNLFNMGDVVIRTGGADGELVFERVWNPRRVQREIVDRLEDFQRRQQQSQQNAHRREIAEWLTTYDQIKAQS